MSDVRCPMCGKQNPADLEVCQFCEARLKPLQVTPPADEPTVRPGETPEPKDTHDLESSLPDWLQSLRGSDQPAQTPSASEESLPDWLSDLRGQSFEEEEIEHVEPEAITSKEDSEALPVDALPEEEPDLLRRIGIEGEGLDTPPSSEVPEWLAELEDASPDIEPATVPDWFAQETDDHTAPEEALPEWLSEEGADVSEQLAPLAPEEAPSMPVPGEPEGEELPEWLTQPTAEEEAPEPAVPAQEGEEEIPDWLAVEGEEIPDWLAQPTVEEEAPEPAILAQEGEAELPDWLAGEGEEIPDWLAQPTIEEEAPEPAVPAQEGEAELPDWLAGEGEEIPDWLAQPTAEEEAPEPAVPAQEGKEELPDWLAGEGEELPEWLAQPTTGEEALVAEEPAPKPVEELPDWLSGDEIEGLEWISDQGAEVAAPEIPEDRTPETELVDSMDVEEEPSGVEEPDLLAVAGLGVSDELAEDDLDWLAELETAFPEMPSEEEVSKDAGLAESSFLAEGTGGLEPVHEDALPSWLAEVDTDSGEEISEPSEPPEKEEGEELMPADLPSWLEAMRPVAVVGMAADEDQQVETLKIEGAGPLTGLKGVLPAEPDVVQTSKPPAYSVKLQITDEQQTNADLLAQLIEVEAVAQPVPGPQIVTPQHILRLMIAALLILAILLPVGAGVPELSMPSFTPEVSATNQLIGGLSGGSPVLLAIDYEAGLSGEMDTIAAAVVDHLMIKGVFLTLVSTTPTGPMQAERLLTQVEQLGGHQYGVGDQYVNLGFIPGSSTGLLNFAETPRQAVPVDMNGQSVWTTPALQGINSLTNFTMVIVATENPNTARAWIEQVQPTLGNTPMVMIISAQAEPIVRPYYEANPKQIQGLISGLSAAASYETLLGRSGQAGVFWSPFSIGMLVAGFLILVGGAVNAISALMARGKEKPEGEKA